MELARKRNTNINVPFVKIDTCYKSILNRKCAVLDSSKLNGFKIYEGMFNTQ